MKVCYGNKQPYNVITIIILFTIIIVIRHWTWTEVGQVSKDCFAVLWYAAMTWATEIVGTWIRRIEIGYEHLPEDVV